MEDELGDNCSVHRNTPIELYNHTTEKHPAFKELEVEKMCLGTFIIEIIKNVII